MTDKKDLPTFGGMLGKAQKALAGREAAIQAAEDAAMGNNDKKNQDAAEGKKRLTPQDHKY